MTREPHLLHNSQFTFADATGAEMSCHLQLWHRGPNQALLIATRLPERAEVAAPPALVLAEVMQRWEWMEDAIYIDHTPASAAGALEQWQRVEWDRHDPLVPPTFTPTDEYALTSKLDHPLAPIVFDESQARLLHNGLFTFWGTNLLQACCHLQLWQISDYSFLAVATDLPRGNPGQSVTNAAVAIANTIRRDFKLRTPAHLELVEHYTAGRYGGHNDPETWDRVILNYDIGAKARSNTWQPSSKAEAEALLGRPLEPIELAAEYQYRPGR